jgi:hypothetical protein
LSCLVDQDKALVPKPPSLREVGKEAWHHHWISQGRKPAWAGRQLGPVGGALLVMDKRDVG